MGHAAPRPRNAKAPPPRRTGGSGSGPATRRCPATGTDSRTRYAEDFALLAVTRPDPSPAVDRVGPPRARAGHPRPGGHRHYRDVLTAARDAGIVPWVSLHHFTLPRWFLQAGGFLVEANRTEAWRRHVDFVAETFGDLVGGWQPINETNYYARAAYGGRGWPPGHDDKEEVAFVNEAIHLASAEAAVRLKQTGAPVASIFGLSPIVPQDDDPATRRIGAVPRRLLLGAMDRPVPRRRAQGPPSGAGRAPRPGGLLRHDRLLLLRRHGRAGRPAAPSTRLARRSRRSATASGPTESDWSSTACTSELPGAPLLVAEYGIGTDDDEVRAAYLRTRPGRSSTRRSSGASTFGASSTGRPSTTTSGSTATTCPSGSSTATARCDPAPTCCSKRRSSE